VENSLPEGHPPDVSRKSNLKTGVTAADSRKRGDYCVRKQYNVGGQPVWGEEVPFEPEREVFNSYILEDGTNIRFKAVVLKFIRLEQFDPEGNPIYMVTATNALVADVPDRLKRGN
jgi:hypothetical protein